MSYIRFGIEGSQVYVIDNVEGGYSCFSCTLHPEQGETNLPTPHEMADHLRTHKAAGGLVPDGVIDALEAHQHCVDRGMADQCTVHG